MITNIYGGKKQITCDNCGESFEADDWEEARTIMKQDGWRSVKTGDVWQNYCLDCRDDIN